MHGHVQIRKSGIRLASRLLSPLTVLLALVLITTSFQLRMADAHELRLTLSTQVSTPVSVAAGNWLAFQWNGRVHISRSDGTEDREVTLDWTGGEQLHPDWSPDGSRLAFSADEADGTRDLWIVSLDGNDAIRIFDCMNPCIAADDPAWSPDGTRIAFGQFAGDNGRNVGTLEVISLDDMATETVFHGDDAENIFVPRWSPDGAKIVFELDRFREPTVESATVVGMGIAILDLNSGPESVRMLTELDTFSGSPDWSPTGDQIVFVMATSGSPDGPFDLFIADLEQSEPEQLTRLAGTGYQAIQPGWSPDGEFVIFVKDQMWTNPFLAGVRLDGSTIEAFEDAQLHVTHPRALPNG